MSATPQTEPRSWLQRGWWLWLSLGWVVLGVLFAAQAVWIGGLSWETSLGWALLDWGWWVPLAPIVVWLARRIEITAGTWRRALPVHAALAVGFAVGIELMSSLVLQRGWMPAPRPVPREGFGRPGEPVPRRGPGERREMAGGPERPPGGRESGLAPRRDPDGNLGSGGGRPPRPEGPRLRLPPGTGRGRLALPIYLVLVAGAHALAYHRRFRERELRALQAEARLAEARALALQNQLQPHFFFNALNTVAALIYTRPEQAEETICALGELMRGVLDAAHRSEIPLREELAFIDRYLAVQQIRFGERLQVARDIAEETLACAVPTLLLQPLVENAVVHGIEPFAAPGRLVLRARRTAGRLLLEVENTCGAEAATAPAGPVEFVPRIGLANTRARLEALHADGFRLTHRRTEAGVVVTAVELPWKGAGT